MVFSEVYLLCYNIGHASEYLLKGDVKEKDSQIQRKGKKQNEKE